VNSTVAAIDQRAEMATRRKKLLPARTAMLLLAGLFVFDCLAFSEGEWTDIP